MKNTTMLNLNRSKIPLWINIMQGILILIMLNQVFNHFFNLHMLAYSGIQTQGKPALNLIYKMGSRTFVMVLISTYVMISQDPKQYIVILTMNIIKEVFETIVDPFFPLLNAYTSPIVDFGIHILIITLEVLAFIIVLKLIKQNSKNISRYNK